MVERLVLAMALSLLPCMCNAADVYKWVDEEGRIHYADSVPDRYKSTAARIDTDAMETRGRAPTLGGAGTTAQDEAECARLWRAYRESQECFAPYQRRQGGTRVEAYEHCAVVESPTVKCGSPRW